MSDPLGSEENYMYCVNLNFSTFQIELNKDIISLHFTIRANQRQVRRRHLLIRAKQD
jgi:hypothetical protein